MKKTQIVLLVFLVVAVCAIIGTVYNADTYSGFAEARENPGREFHIIGNLVEGEPVSEEVVESTLTLNFSMVDNLGEREEVLYFGPKPIDFELSDEIVLIGRYEGGRFVASSMLLKCPSRYKPGDIEISSSE